MCHDWFWFLLSLCTVHFLWDREGLVELGGGGGLGLQNWLLRDGLSKKEKGEVERNSQGLFSVIFIVCYVNLALCRKHLPVTLSRLKNLIKVLGLEVSLNARPFGLFQFKPLEQLMGVFPAASGNFIPPTWRDLMSNPVIETSFLFHFLLFVCVSVFCTWNQPCTTNSVAICISCPLCCGVHPKERSALNSKMTDMATKVAWRNENNDGVSHTP